MEEMQLSDKILECKALHDWETCACSWSSILSFVVRIVCSRKNATNAPAASARDTLTKGTVLSTHDQSRQSQSLLVSVVPGTISNQSDKVTIKAKQKRIGY